MLPLLLPLLLLCAPGATASPLGPPPNATAMSAGPFPVFSQPAFYLSQTPQWAAAFECFFSTRESSAKALYVRVGSAQSYIEAQFARNRLRFSCKGTVRCHQGYRNGLQSFNWGFITIPETRISIRAFPSTGMLVVAVGPASREVVAFQYDSFFNSAASLEDAAVLSSVSISSPRRIKVIVSAISSVS